MFSPSTGRIVRVFKDQGEQRLAVDIAHAMARTIPPGWEFEAIAPVPASVSAYRRRGYDHAQLIARALSTEVGTPTIEALERPRTRDQRALSGMQRVKNLEGSFSARSDVCESRKLLLVDDVFTTGATICSATDALLAAGASEVRCLTFARV